MVTPARTAVVWFGLVVGIATACKGKDEMPTIGNVETGSGYVTDRDASTGFAAPTDADEPPLVDADAGPAKLEEPEPPDPGKLIAELGAIPAWQAVVDRAQLLARRKQRGVVYGTVGSPILVPGPPPTPSDAGVVPDAGMVASPYMWLICDTDGNGALGIIVTLGER